MALRSSARRVIQYGRANAPWRLAMPNRTVRRHVQGVDLYLPWSHKLPDYARSAPMYGQNLVELAGELGSRLGDAGPLRVLDIGANIGDSALQILARTPAEVLCVEGDPYWSAYLRRNVEQNNRVTIAECFLTVPELALSGGTPVRSTGTTTHFVEDAASTIKTVPVSQLRSEYPNFDQIRLIKSDTDGMDVALVPAILEAWKDCGPVAFLEYDVRLTKSAGYSDPNQLWDRLAALDYRHVAVWDNGGRALGQFEVADGPRHSEILNQEPRQLGYYFWDIAVCRDDDVAAREAFDRLVPSRFA